VFGSTLASLELAQEELDENVSDCVGYIQGTFTSKTFSASHSTPNTLNYDVSASNTFLEGVYSSFSCYSSIALPLNGILSVAYNGGGTSYGNNEFQVAATLYTCNFGSIVQSKEIAAIGPQSGTFVFDPVDEENEYIIVVSVRGPRPSSAGSSTLTGTFTISSSLLVVNPVIARWDDSGTVRYLEACPKTIIPSVGSFYASEAIAQTAIADDVSGCIGYNLSVSSDGSTRVFTASGFTFSAVYTPSVIPLSSIVIGQKTILCSINCLAGETISMDYSIIVGTGLRRTTEVEMNIYDLNFQAVSLNDVNISDSGPISGTITSSIAMPFTGKYYIQMLFKERTFESFFDSLSLTYTISSSGTITMNQIQAAYDVNLSCGARLNC
jgi:hypothetical protein